MRAALLLFVSLAACQAAPAAGTLCTRASDCAAGLVCSRARCRSACATSNDCGPLARCLVDPANGVGSCSLEIDSCRTHDCPVGFLCREDECLNACDSIVRCPDGVCRDGACLTVHGDAGAPSDAGLDASAAPHLRLAALGSHFCVVSPAAELWCWGAADHYELGDRQVGHGDCAACSAAPVRALSAPGVPLASVSAVSGSHGFTCALAAGDVVCWGSGPLGTQSTSAIDPQTAIDHEALPGITSITAGVEHVCVLAAGAPWCWGNGTDGRLGDGTLSSSTTPVSATALVASASPAALTAIVAARHHTQALASDGRVLGVGNNDSFELAVEMGPDAGGPTTTPLVAPTMTATAIASEGGTTCALEADGRVACWGIAISYVAGSLACPDGTCAEIPTYVEPPSGETILGIATSRFALCVWTSAGSAYCIGAPEIAGSHAALALVPGVSSVVEIVAAELAMCARTADDHVACWGSNASGQLGRGTHDDGEFPTAVPVALPF